MYGNPAQRSMITEKCQFWVLKHGEGGQGELELCLSSKEDWFQLEEVMYCTSRPPPPSPPSAQAAKMHLNIILDLLERDPQTARLEVWEEEKKGDLKVSNYSTA